MKNPLKIITLHAYGRSQKEQPEPDYHKAWMFQRFLEKHKNDKKTMRPYHIINPQNPSKNSLHG